MPTIARIAPVGYEDGAASEDDDPLCFPRSHRLGPIARYTPRQARPSVDSTPTDLEGIDFYFKSPPQTPLRSSVGRNARSRRLSDEMGGGRSPSVESSGSARGKVSLACSIALLCAAFSRRLLQWIITADGKAGAMPPFDTENVSSHSWPLPRRRGSWMR